MEHRWVRFLVVVAALATLGFSSYQIRRSELVVNEEQSIENVFTELSWALSLELADLRAAQQAYVANGQDTHYWTTRVTNHLEAVRASLDNLRRLIVSPSSINALDNADKAIASLERVDQQAREHTNREQTLLASDLIFTDGLELVNRAAEHVELARASERATRNETVRATRATQTRLLATGTGIGILALLLLTPLRRPLARGTTSEPEEHQATGSGTLDIKGYPVSGNGTKGPSTSDVPVDHGSAPKLQEAAKLCTDLGGLTDANGLPDLLARAAALINASGLILWVKDTDGSTLRAAGEYGYGRDFLQRFNSIPEDGNNPTAKAFRESSLQVVPSGNSTNGALAQPLMVGDRCVGVLSAELRDGWESKNDVHAITTILAAQLASLIPANVPNKSDTAAAAHG